MLNRPRFYEQQILIKFVSKLFRIHFQLLSHEVPPGIFPLQVGCIAIFWWRDTCLFTMAHLPYVVILVSPFGRPATIYVPKYQEGTHPPICLTASSIQRPMVPLFPAATSVRDFCVSPYKLLR